ncbi:hypothetical protein [Terriglobus sp. RCC_193]|uniref:hypothetical protein n=1 Tax=Terriglobus sp. RCC_193 TaxID=3239218 RepID=UPI00352616F8
MRRGNVRTRETGERNGRWTQLEFAVASLPPKARERYEVEQRKLQVEEPAQLALATFMQPRPLPVAPRVVLNDTAAREAAERREVLAPLLDWINYPDKRLGLRLLSGAAVRTQTDMIQWLAEQRGMSDSTVKRMLKRYREGGEANLAKKPRKDAGQSRFFSEHPDAAALVAFTGYADGTHVSARAAERALRQQGWRLGLGLADLPSYDTIRRFLDAADKDLKELARKGEKKYGDIVMPYLQRAYTEYANQVWIADTMKADVFTQNDVFDWIPKNQKIRLQLSAIVDYRSRYFVGWCWGVEESSVPIGAALRNAVLAHGPAEQFYCDNGKAYRKVARGALRGHMVQPGADLTTIFDDISEMEMRLGILARLGMSVTHCIPNHPQSKHVERQFRTVHEQYDTMWTKAYTGGAPHLRPEISGHTMAHHDKAVKDGEPERSHLPLASDYIKGFSAWVDWHHQQPMDAEGMDRRSPAEVFKAERNPRQRPRPLAVELAGTFEERAIRSVIRGGIDMHGERYIAAYDDAHATSVMLALSGGSDDRSKVQVLYDSLDRSSVAIADERGRVLCVLVKQEKLNFAPHDQETQAKIAQGMQRARGSLRASKDKLASIQRTGRILGAKTRLELLAENVPTTPGPDIAGLITQPKQPRKIAPQAAAPMCAHDVAAMIAAMED